MRATARLLPWPTTRLLTYLLAFRTVTCTFFTLSRPRQLASSRAVQLRHASLPKRVVPHHMPLDIIHEDEHLLVVNKPSGLVVDASPKSVESAVAFHLNSTSCRWNSSSWPWNRPDSFEGLVHRLDKDTSGLMVIAKNPTTARSLQAAFAARLVHKAYLAIAVGLPSAAAHTGLEAAHSTRSTESSAPQHKSDSERHIAPSPFAPVGDHSVEAQTRRLARDIKECGRDHLRALALLNAGCETQAMPSAACFSAAISVCMRAGERDAALAILDSMDGRGVVPNVLCFKTALSLCVHDPPLWQTAVALLERMDAIGLRRDARCVSSAISACGRAGQLDAALALLGSLHEAGDCAEGGGAGGDGAGSDDMDSACLRAAIRGQSNDASLLASEAQLELVGPWEVLP